MCINKNFMDLKRICMIFCLFFLGFMIKPCLAQEEQGECAFILQEAENLYSQGLIEGIPEMLDSCIRMGFTQEERLQAYKLIILTLLFDDEQEQADQAMLAFITRYPEYEIAPTDPVEFIYLFETYDNSPKISFGIMGGLNLANNIIKEQYGTYNYDNSDKDFNLSGMGFQVGARVNFHLSNSIQLSFEPMLMQNKFENLASITNLDGEQYNELSFDESQTRIEFPLTGTYDFEFGNFKPYARLGINLGLITNVYSKITRTYTDGSQNIDVTGPDINIPDYRKKLNYWAVIGGGIKYKIPRSYIMLDLRYNLGLSNQAKPNDRLVFDSEQIWKYHYIDDNFTLDNFAFSVGFVYLLYKPRKIEL